MRRIAIRRRIWGVKRRVMADRGMWWWRISKTILEVVWRM